jgi:DNA-binding CsgD family transcriptional regulator
VDVLERGISVLPSDAPERLALEAQLISTAVADPATLRRVVDRIAPLRDRVQGDSSAERVLLAALAMISMMRGKPADVAAKLAERALGGDRLIREQSADALAVYQAAFVLGIADRIEPAKSATDAALHDAQTRGSLLAFALASVNRSFLHYWLGALADAEADASNALRALPWDQWLTQPIAVALYVTVLVEKGDLATASALLQDHNFDDRLPETAVFQFVLHSRGKLRLAQGDGLGAIADFRELERRMNDGHLTLLGLTEISLARLRIGEQEQARADAERSLALARAWGTRSAIGVALRAAGLVEGGETGLDLLREATATLEASPAQLEYARALVDFGAQLRRRGLRSDARHPLKQGLHLASFCGAWALAERALVELRAAGGRPRQATITGVEALTANEHRVADMAAQGLSNRQIAQALFVTTRTIESHLTNAYRKLGITSRDQLASALHPAPPIAETRDK